MNALDKTISKYFFSEANFSDLLELLHDAGQTKFGVSLTKDINILLLDIMKFVFQNRSVYDFSEHNRSDIMLILNKDVLSRCFDIIHREIHQDGNTSPSPNNNDLKNESTLQNQNPAINPPNAKAGFDKKLYDMLQSRNEDNKRIESQQTPTEDDSLRRAGIRTNITIPKDEEKDQLESKSIEKDANMLQKYEEMKRIREQEEAATLKDQHLGQHQVEPSSRHTVDRRRDFTLLNAIPEEDENPETDDDALDQASNGGLPDDIWSGMTTDGDMAGEPADFKLARPHLQTRIRDQVTVEAIDDSVKEKSRVAITKSDVDAESDGQTAQSFQALIIQRLNDNKRLTFPAPTPSTIQTVQGKLELPKKDLYPEIDAPTNPSSQSYKSLISAKPRLEDIRSQSDSLLSSKIEHLSELVNDHRQSMKTVSDNMNGIMKEVSQVLKDSKQIQHDMFKMINEMQMDKHRINISKEPLSAPNGHDLKEVTTGKLFTSLTRHKDITNDSHNAYNFGIKLDADITIKYRFEKIFFPVGDAIRPGCGLPVAILTIGSRTSAVCLVSHDREYMTCDLTGFGDRVGLLIAGVVDLQIQLCGAFGYQLIPPSDLIQINCINNNNLRILIESSGNHALRNGDRVIFDDILCDNASLSKWMTRDEGHEAIIIDLTHLEIDSAVPCDEIESFSKAQFKKAGRLIKAKSQSMVLVREIKSSI